MHYHNDMAHFFEQINHMVNDAELAGILIIVLIASLIILNITACICIISAKRSLKRIANHFAPKTKKSSTHERAGKDSKTA